MSYALTGLTPNTEYFFQVEAVGGAATVYGTVLNFTTLAAAPTATTNAATSVTATGATLNGTVNNENNTSTTVTFCYKATGDHLRDMHRRHLGDGHPVAGDRRLDTPP